MSSWWGIVAFDVRCRLEITFCFIPGGSLLMHMLSITNDPFLFLIHGWYAVERMVFGTSHVSAVSAIYRARNVI